MFRDLLMIYMIKPVDRGQLKISIDFLSDKLKILIVSRKIII